MRHKLIVRTLSLVFAAVSLLAFNLAAQEPDAPSVAEAARRAREQKKAAAKSTTVITNDTLPPGATSTSNSSQATQSQPGGDAALAQDAADSSSTSDEAAKKKDQIASLKQQITDKQNELDVLQRELAPWTWKRFSPSQIQRMTKAERLTWKPGQQI